MHGPHRQSPRSNEVQFCALQKAIRFPAVTTAALWYTVLKFCAKNYIPLNIHTVRVHPTNCYLIVFGFRLSFPSGHASLSMYAAVFLTVSYCLYLASDYLTQSCIGFMLILCVLIDVPPGANAPAKVGFVKAFVASCSVVGCFLHRLHSVNTSMRKLNSYRMFWKLTYT